MIASTHGKGCSICIQPPLLLPDAHLTDCRQMAKTP